MWAIQDIFGVTSDQLAQADARDPTTPLRTYSTAQDSPGAQNVPSNAFAAMLDPRGSAIFWIALFAILGLILVTGQIKVEGAVGSRVGRKR
ncbi:MAG TPA: hypothetical protein VIM33_04875 [Gaiellaceae bacterium]